MVLSHNHQSGRSHEIIQRTYKRIAGLASLARSSLESVLKTVIVRLRVGLRSKPRIRSQNSQRSWQYQKSTIAGLFSYSHFNVVEVKGFPAETSMSATEQDTDTPGPSIPPDTGTMFAALLPEMIKMNENIQSISEPVDFAEESSEREN